MEFMNVTYLFNLFFIYFCQSKSSKIRVVVPGRIYQGHKSSSQHTNGMRIKISPQNFPQIIPQTSPSTGSSMKSSRNDRNDRGAGSSKKKARVDDVDDLEDLDACISSSRYKTIFASASMVQELFLVCRSGELPSAAHLAQHLQELMVDSGANIRVESLDKQGKRHALEDDFDLPREDRGDLDGFDGQESGIGGGGGGTSRKLSIAEKKLNKKFHWF